MNLVILTGRVATDIDCRATKEGTLVAHFNIAVPFSFKKDKDGKIPVGFYRVNAWEKIAENCRDYLAKGRRVILRGHLTNNEFTNKDGLRVRSTEVTADLVEFGDRRKEKVGDSEAYAGEQKTKPAEIANVPELEDMSLPQGMDEMEVPW